MPSQSNHPDGAVLPPKATMVPVGTPLAGGWLTHDEPLLVRTLPFEPGDVRPVPPDDAGKVIDNPPAVIELWFIQDGADAPVELKTCPLDPAANMDVVLVAL